MKIIDRQNKSCCDYSSPEIKVIKIGPQFSVLDYPPQEEELES